MFRTLQMLCGLGMFLFASFAVRGQPAPLRVNVSVPIEQAVMDYAHFTGRAVPVAWVEIRARVSGYLQEIHFKDGTLVKEDDLLFGIDARAHEASLRQSEGNLEAVQARLQRLDVELARARQLLSSRAIPQAEFDKIASERAEAAAALQPARTAVERAKLDLSYTKIRAPIAGRIGRALVTLGNLVQSGEQPGGSRLATIVSVDPMYVYFDVDERTVLRMRQLAREGTVAISEVAIGLANEEGFPHRGKIDFADNQIDPKTGTLQMRAVFSNKHELLIPGLSVRLQIPMGRPRQALLVNERAVVAIDIKSVVYVVNADNVVTARPIRLGQRYDGLREIEDGLKAGERVIVDSSPQISPRATVEPILIEMPRERVTGEPTKGNPGGSVRSKQP